MSRGQPGCERCGHVPALCLVIVETPTSIIKAKTCTACALRAQAAVVEPALHFRKRFGSG